MMQVDNATTESALAYARMYLQRAERGQHVDRLAFKPDVQTAIVWGRSVTFHLQKEYRHRPGFEEWYADIQKRLQADPLCRFFVDTRNVILKQAPVGIKRVVHLSATVHAWATATVEAEVVRGKPWYRRSFWIIWEDAVAAVSRPFHRWRQRRKRAHNAAEATKLAGGSAKEDFFYFDSPQWRDRPALELLAEYLDGLEVVVREAETRFDSPSEITTVS